MRRAGLGACLPLLFLLAAGASGQPEEPFRPKGGYDNSVHRFHPDLEARLNAVRFARWRTVEIAWDSGATEELDREISAYALFLATHPPRFPPEADRVAPLLARDAAPIFRALRWGQTLEQQLLDVLASSDAEEMLSAARLDRALLLYRRERWALSEPAQSAAAASSPETGAGRVETAGARLFARAAEDLTPPDFAQQRWRVKQTVADFDRGFGGDRPAETATYMESAPAVAKAFPTVARALDRVEQFRQELLEVLRPAGTTLEARRRRADAAREVARRYGIPIEGIGEARWP